MPGGVEEFFKTVRALGGKLTKSATLVFLLVCVVAYMAVVAAGSSPARMLVSPDLVRAKADSAAADDTAKQLARIQSDMAVMRVELNTKLDALQGRMKRVEDNIDRNRGTQ